MDYPKFIVLNQKEEIKLLVYKEVKLGGGGGGAAPSPWLPWIAMC